ncbi:hypothetical protein EON67_12480, partial [archaeon]
MQYVKLLRPDVPVVNRAALAAQSAAAMRDGEAASVECGSAAACVPARAAVMDGDAAAAAATADAATDTADAHTADRHLPEQQRTPAVPQAHVRVQQLACTSSRSVPRFSMPPRCGRRPPNVGAPGRVLSANRCAAVRARRHAFFHPCACVQMCARCRRQLYFSCPSATCAVGRCCAASCSPAACR